MNTCFALLACLLASSMAAAAEFEVRQLADVYVQDFSSDAPEQCRPSDVDLTHAQAKDFFLRAKQVSSRVIHDHYDFAPCYIEGTLTYRGKPCEWQIRAGGTGQIVCGKRTHHFACDACEDLFKPK